MTISYQQLIMGIQKENMEYYNIFKERIMNHIHNKVPEYDYIAEDIFDDIMECILEYGFDKYTKNTTSDVIGIVNSVINKYKKKLTVINENEVELSNEIYYSDNLITNQINREEMSASISYTLNTLTPNESRVLRERFFNLKTLDHVGKDFGVSRERILQIEAKALRKLRHPTRRYWLGSFLENDIIPEFNNYQKVVENYETMKIDLNLPHNYYISKIEEQIHCCIKRHEEIMKEEKKRVEIIRKRELLKRFEKEKKKQAEIRQRELQKRLEEKKKKEEEEKRVDPLYNDMILNYTNVLNGISNLLYKIMDKIKGHRRELYAIILNYSGFRHDVFKEQLIEFYNKYKDKE